MHNTYHHLVSCPVLPNPDNGMANCQLGDDNVLSYEDTCDFTCNAGYNFVGSNIRTCQSDGSWNGTETFCRRSKLCLPLSVVVLINWDHNFLPKHQLKTYLTYIPATTI